MRVASTEVGHGPLSFGLPSRLPLCLWEFPAPWSWTALGLSLHIGHLLLFGGPRAARCGKQAARPSWGQAVRGRAHHHCCCSARPGACTPLSHPDASMRALTAHTHTCILHPRPARRYAAITPRLLPPLRLSPPRAAPPLCPVCRWCAFLPIIAHLVVLSYMHCPSNKHGARAWAYLPSGLVARPARTDPAHVCLHGIDVRACTRCSRKHFWTVRGPAPVSASSPRMAPQLLPPARPAAGRGALVCLWPLCNCGFNPGTSAAPQRTY